MEVSSKLATPQQYVNLRFSEDQIPAQEISGDVDVLSDERGYDQLPPEEIPDVGDILFETQEGHKK